MLGMDAPEIEKAEARHLDVLRPKGGEEIELFDARGLSRIYRYDAAAKRLFAAGSAIAKFQRPRISLSLFACITKGSRWDWTIEKATELGVTCIVPVISSRTIVRLGKGERAAKRERWQRVAMDAARQSNAVWLPEIAEAIEFDGALALAKKTLCFAGALAEPRPRPLLEVVSDALEKNPGTREVSVFVGPEGDFSSEELKALLAFAVPANFGDLILRAETAAMFGISVLRAAIDAAERKGAIS